MHINGIYVVIKRLHDKLSVLRFRLDILFNHMHSTVDTSNLCQVPRVIRYYHNIPDRDAHEALSEEDLYAAQTLKGPPRRSSAGYHPNWIPQRSSADRYDVTTLPTQPSRRARTRPEMKSFAEAEFADRRKCSRCGNVTTMTKSSTPRRNNYSFQDSPNFATKGHFGK